MCRQVTCRQCNKVTWSGCGAHVDAVMRGVSEQDRCRCHEQRGAAQKSAAPAPGGGFWSSLFGK